MGIDLCAAALVENNAVFLLRPRSQSKWIMPSGKLTNTGTSEIQVRQMLLTGIGVHVLQIGQPMIIEDVSFDGAKKLAIRFHQVSHFMGAPVIADESAYPESTWATMDRLEHYSLAPGDRRYIEHLLQVGVLVRSQAA